MPSAPAQIRKCAINAYGSLPAHTVGSLQRKSQVDLLLEFIKTLLEDKNPADKLKQLDGLVDDVFQLMPSGKHMVGRDLGRLGSTTSLQYRTAR